MDLAQPTMGDADALRARHDAEAAMGALFDVMRRLYGPGGCPWDAKQTPETLRAYVLEEAYEVLDAIDGGEPTAIRDELGDLLFQVVFQAEIFRNRGEFALADVAHAIREKLLRRHPHVFGPEHERGATTAQITARWEVLKREERRAKGEDTSALAGIPKALPSLVRAQKLGERAARQGFDWPDLAGVLAKLDEERAELSEALAGGETAHIEAELGDLLFTVVNLCRRCGVEAETALRGTASRFEARFRRVEQRCSELGKAPHEVPLATLESFWQAAKRETVGDP